MIYAVALQWQRRGPPDITLETLFGLGVLMFVAIGPVIAAAVWPILLSSPSLKAFEDRA